MQGNLKIIDVMRYYGQIPNIDAASNSYSAFATALPQ
jgi:hypothetical protein